MISRFEQIAYNRSFTAEYALDGITVRLSLFYKRMCTEDSKPNRHVVINTLSVNLTPIRVKAHRATA